MSSDQPDKYEPLTIYVNLKKQGYATTTRHGQSIDARLHRPIPTLANIKEGEGFVVYIDRNKKAILLIRASELNNREKVQATLGGMQPTRLLTPGFITEIVSQAAQAEAATIYRGMGRSKPRIRHLHKRK
jgi:hypothetical protein